MMNIESSEPCEFTMKLEALAIEFEALLTELQQAKSSLIHVQYMRKELPGIVERLKKLSKERINNPVTKP